MGYTTYGTFNNSAVEDRQLFKKDAKAAKKVDPPLNSHSSSSFWRKTKNAVNAALPHSAKEQAAAPMDFDQYRIRCV